MSALGKLSRFVGRNGKQSAAFLLDGYCGEQLASSVRLVRFQQSQWLHQETRGSVLLKPLASQINQVRGFFGKKDDVEIDPDSKLPLTHPTKGVLMYYGKWASYTKNVKVLSLSTSMIAVFLQPLIMSAAKDDKMFKISLLASLSTCMFMTPLLVHFVTKKYVTDIYYNDDTKMFTLATRSFFLRRKELEYKATDVEFQFVPRAYVTHVIKGQSFFIIEEDFRDMEIYKHMVGFDKPFELNKGQKKSFGLFEDEKDKRVAAKPAPYVPTWNTLYDDDDDEIQRQKEQQQQQQEQQQQNQVGSK